MNLVRAALGHEAVMSVKLRSLDLFALTEHDDH